ncbi:MAG TPA: ABC transporter ATP-binding protein [Candidatus Competibacteraceae bacterium]|nr:ABC transporter ATP-binding protein [Candidatus Competibacteraceae bacterium]
MSLVLDQVSKRVTGSLHIDQVSLTLEPGTFNVLLGRTLAGKTSLMRLMAGLDKPSSGQVLMNGQDVTRTPVQKRNVAMVYQQFINYPSLTVYDNIASPLKLAGLDPSSIDRKVREAAEMLHIEKLLERLPGELSGGQQQRTAIARALVKDAALLLFDEPLVNLDYKLREELRAELREIFQTREAIVVYATTEPQEALTLGGRVVVLHEGRVLQHGPTLEVYHHPASLTVGEVFSDPPLNHVSGVVEPGTLLLGHDLKLAPLGHLARLAPGRYTFGIRANHLSVRRQSEADVAVRAEAELAEISGSETYIHVRYGHDNWVLQEEGVHEYRLGDEVTVYFDPRHLFVFDLHGILVAAPQRGVVHEATAAATARTIGLHRVADGSEG